MERFRVMALSSRAARLIGGGGGGIVLCGIRYGGHVIAIGKGANEGGGEGRGGWRRRRCEGVGMGWMVKGGEMGIGRGSPKQ